MTWRCPHCGCPKIHVVGQQTYAVEREYRGEDVMYCETLDPTSDVTVTLVECMSCGATDDTDKDWHMSLRQWHEELEGRRADYEYERSLDR